MYGIKQEHILFYINCDKLYKRKEQGPLKEDNEQDLT